MALPEQANPVRVFEAPSHFGDDPFLHYLSVMVMMFVIPTKQMIMNIYFYYNTYSGCLDAKKNF